MQSPKQWAGEKYEGEFAAGLKHGQGRVTLADGMCYNAKYHLGKRASRYAFAMMHAAPDSDESASVALLENLMVISNSCFCIGKSDVRSDATSSLATCKGMKMMEMRMMMPSLNTIIIIA